MKRASNILPFVYFTQAAIFFLVGFLCYLSGIFLGNSDAKLGGAALIMVAAMWMTAGEGADPHSTRRTRRRNRAIAAGAFLLLLIRVWGGEG